MVIGRGLWGLSSDLGRRVPKKKMALHELGESLAATVASVQEELSRYPNAVGSFALDEVELSVAVDISLDEVGQVRVRPLDERSTGPGRSQLRLRLRTVPGPPSPPPPSTALPLSALRSLPQDGVEKLEARRIFSIEDLQRAARSVGGRAALNRLRLGASLEDLLGRAAMLSLPVLPAEIAQALLAVGMTTPAAFAKAESGVTAAALSEALGRSVAADQVQRWQRDVMSLCFPELLREVTSPREPDPRASGSIG